ncbi:MAG: hypothetical protein IKN72_06960 [Clostridia bacterium]|nr:hypothetical protein [Clostridia bacterium]MBR3553112.1 hypothetical protein [Clostridia bacterium]
MKKTIFKRTLAVALCLLMLCACGVSAFAAALPDGAVLLSNSKTIDPDQVNLIAYRGLSACAPENTLAAIELAGRCGCNGVALDIQPTLDGEWVCFAGVSVDMNTNGSGTVSTLTAAQLDELTIDRGSHVSDYPNEKIPTLRQAIVVAQLYKMKLVLTINGGTTEELQFVIDKLDTLMTTLKLFGVEKTATIVSADQRVLDAVKAAGGRPALNTLVPIPLLVVNTCVTNGYVGFAGRYVDPLTIKNAADQGLEVYGTNVTTIFEAETYYKAGMRTIVSQNLVKHEPTEVNVAASAFSKVSTWLRTIINKAVAFFQKLLKDFALDQLFGSLRA